MAASELDDLRRLVCQSLESWRRDGLTHGPRLAVEFLHAAQVPAASKVTARPPAPPPKPAAASVVSVAAPVTVAPEPAPRELPLMARTQFLPSPPPEPLNLPRAERVTQLEVLADRVKTCVRCPELAATRTQTVFGVGNPEAKIMFIGEAPGADEDRTGEPFVGRAGQLLNDIIAACKLTRAEIYICNVLRCRPPGNRLPTPAEASNCREYLDGQISIVNPDYIVCWGSTAAKAVLASDKPIGKLRGQLFDFGRAKVLCTYHPSYLLRNPAAKKDVWEDMKFFFREMGIDITRK